MSSLPRVAQWSCSTASRLRSPLAVAAHQQPSPSSASSSSWGSAVASRRGASTKSGSPTRGTKAPPRRDAGNRNFLVKSKGRLGLSSTYLQDLVQLGIAPSTSDDPSPSSPGPSTGSKRNPPPKKTKARPPHVPIKERIFASQQLELRTFLKAKKEEERDKRLRRLEESDLARKRNRWAWEWFEEGRELGDIGARVALLPKYSSEEPYPAATVTEWILSHLRSTPSAAPVSERISGGVDAGPASPLAERTHSFGLLTPESWARLSAPHPFWSTKPYEASLGPALANEEASEQGVWDLLWARGWRGEGLGVESAGPEAGEDRGTKQHDAPMPLSADVLARFLKVEEIRAAQQDLAPGGLGRQQGSRGDRYLDCMPESARIAMALERLKLKRGEDGMHNILREIKARRAAGGTGATSSSLSSPTALPGTSRSS